MNTETTLYQLEKQLSLKGMAAKLRGILELPSHARPSIEMALAEMIETELEYRKNAKTDKLLRASKLRFKTPIQEISCSTERNLSKDQLMALSTCDFIRDGRHVIITGKAGCGKTWLSCALGRQACLLGYKVLFFNMVRFTEEVSMQKLTGSLMKFVDRIMKHDLVIFDDFALRPIDEDTRLVLYQILDGNQDSYKKSIIFTSQLPVGDWYDYLLPGSQTESILDRLSGSERIELKGKSMRKNKN